MKKQDDFEKMLGSTQELLRDVKNVPEDSDFSVEAILAEYGSHKPAAPAHREAPRPEKAPAQAKPAPAAEAAADG